MGRGRRRVPGLVCLLVTACLCTGPAVGAAAPDPAPSTLRFREVSAAWGLAFRHHNAASGSFYMPETMGSGVVLFDYDGDGDPDVFFVDSGTLPGYQGVRPVSRLFRNDGGGRFVDVTERSGIVVAAYGMGGTAGDVDGDGDLDLYVTSFGPNQLFRNDGDGTFTDVTAAAGVGEPSWSSSAAFADVDGDGDLDLYVAAYVDFSFANNPICGRQDLGLRSYCHPDVYDGLPDHFFRNRGDGTFVDDTAAAGFGRATGKGLGVVFGDVDQDGRDDLYVANDMTPNFLFHNLGGGRFEEIGMLAGVALSDEAAPEAGMGVDLVDVDGNELPDIVETHLDGQTNALYSNQGKRLFIDARYAAHIVGPSLMRVGFGVAFADLDLDGDFDLALANGHIIQNVDEEGRGVSYKEPNEIYENLGDGSFRPVPDPGLHVVRASRGLAVGDLDGDGDLDLAINDSNDAAEVYENVTRPIGRRLAVDLAGVPPNTFAIGAVVTAERDGVRQEHEVRTASSYLSQNDLTLTFGAGSAERVDRLRVRWPDGHRTIYLGVPTDARVRVAAP